MQIMMKRDWAYDLVPGFTRRTLTRGKPFDVAPEVAEAAIAAGAAELLVSAIQAQTPAPAEAVLGDEGGEGEGEGENDESASEAPAAPAKAGRDKKAAPAVPAPAEPVEPA